MTTFAREVPRERWCSFLDGIAVDRENIPTILETRNGDGRDQVTERGLLLRSLSYDSRRDVFEVTVIRPYGRREATLAHVVEHPERMFVDSPRGIVPAALSVVDRDGVWTTLRLLSVPAFSG